MKPVSPLPAQEEKRLEALYSYHILDSDPKQNFDDLTELASLICGVPVAVISLVDRDRIRIKSLKGSVAAQSSWMDSFCKHVLNRPGEVLVVPDVRADARFADNPPGPDRLNLTFYAGMALVNEEGFALGCLCVADHEERHLTVAQTEALRLLGRQVMDKLEVRRKSRQLEEVSQRLEQAEAARRKLPQDVSQSEVKFHNIVKQSPVAMATLIGAEHIIELYNDRMLELWGRTGEDVSGVPLFTALPEVSDTGHAQLLKQVYQSGNGKRVRATPVTVMQNGKYRTVWVDALYEPLRNDEDVTGIILLYVDVTEQMTAQADTRKLQDALSLAHAELKEKERNLRIANETANLSLWILEFETEKITVSDTFRMQYGFSPDEALTIDKILGTVEAAYLLQLQQIIADAIVKNKDTVVEYPMRHLKTGERRWMHAVEKVETDAEGKAVRFIGMNRDITEEKEYGLKIESLNRELSAANSELRKAYDELRFANNNLLRQSEDLAVSHELLRESEENLRLAVDAASLGTWMLNLKTDEYKVSEQFKALYGFVPGAKVTVEDVKAAVNPRYLPALLRAIAVCIREKGRIDIPFVIQKRDNGEARWIRKLGKVLTDENGQPSLFIGINADITERKEVEEKIQSLNDELIAINMQIQSVNDDLFNANEELQRREEELSASNEKLSASEEQLRIATGSAQFGVWNLNLQTGELVVSDKLKAIFGLSGSDTITPDNAFSMLAKDDRAMLKNAVQDAISEGKPADVEYSITHKQTGETRWVRTTASVKKNTDGIPLQLIGMTADITERKADEQRKSDFIGMVSHEMNAPLTVIASYLNLIELSAPENDKTIADFAVKATEQVGKLKNIINGFLESEEMRFGKIQLAKTEFNLLELMTELVKEFILTNPAHQFHCEACENVTVSADKGKVSSVISNLLSNAVKYAPGSRIVFIGCQTNKTTGVKVVVQDRGKGIPPEEQKKLFNRFYRSESHKASFIKGHGIGLYLCAEIIQAHGGAIGVNSEEGRGSEFWFTLPV